MNMKTAATGLALVGALGGGAAAANAATSTTPAPSHSASASAGNMSQANGPQGKNQADPFKTKLDALVKAGTITSAQETKILDALKPSGNGPQGGQPGGSQSNRDGRPGMDHRGPQGGQHMRGEHAGGEALAKALGLSESALRADFAKGQTLSQIASAQHKSQADITAALSKAADERIAKQVAAMWNTKAGAHNGKTSGTVGAPSAPSAPGASSTATPAA